MMKAAHVARLFAALCLSSLIAGCAVLPRAGPDDAEIDARATTRLTDVQDTVAFDYALVNLTRHVLSHVPDEGPGSLYRSFGGGRGPAPEILVGVGDTIQVTLFEASTGGLFIPVDAGSRPGNFVTLPAQTVDRSGTISVPYAGLVPAAGRSLPHIQRDIETRLANRAIEPQAIVNILTQRATDVTVLGDVNAPNKFPVNAAGDRVLDIISRAGGARYAGYETYVTLQRGGRKATVFFNTLVERPAENIFVAPGDTIYAYREQRSFLALGASGLSGQLTFEAEKIDLAEAVAKAGGLLDNRADPAQVFVYRLESRATLQRMGVDVSAFDPKASLVPTIYRANFRDPTSFFVAKSFPMRDKDVLYVSNSDSVELVKFLALINAVTSTVAGVADDSVSTRNAVRVLGRAP